MGRTYRAYLLEQDFLVLCRNLKRPPILAGFIFIAGRDPAAVVAVEMWEHALCAGFQAPGVRIENSRLESQRSPRRVISISEAQDSAHFRQKQL